MEQDGGMERVPASEVDASEQDAEDSEGLDDLTSALPVPVGRALLIEPVPSSS